MGKLCVNDNEKLKLYFETTCITRAIPILANGSANYESPCSNFTNTNIKITTGTKT